MCVCVCVCEFWFYYVLVLGSHIVFCFCFFFLLFVYFFYGLLYYFVSKFVFTECVPNIKGSLNWDNDCDIISRFSSVVGWKRFILDWSLVRVIRMCFAFEFGSGFILVIDRWISNLDYFPLRLFILEGLLYSLRELFLENYYNSNENLISPLKKCCSESIKEIERMNRYFSPQSVRFRIRLLYPLKSCNTAKKKRYSR